MDRVGGTDTEALVDFSEYVLFAGMMKSCREKLENQNKLESILKVQLQLE